MKAPTSALTLFALLLILFSTNVASAQCEAAQCDDGVCAVECGECSVCPECDTPMGLEACGRQDAPNGGVDFPDDGEERCENMSREECRACCVRMHPGVGPDDIDECVGMCASEMPGLDAGVGQGPNGPDMGPGAGGAGGEGGDDHGDPGNGEGICENMEQAGCRACCLRVHPGALPVDVDQCVEMCAGEPNDADAGAGQDGGRADGGPGMGGAGGGDGAGGAGGDGGDGGDGGAGGDGGEDRCDNMSREECRACCIRLHPGATPADIDECVGMCAGAPEDPDFDFNDCIDGHYYESMGFPEVSDGARCNNPNCPSFDDFCADPAHRGVGVTACTGPNSCNLGGGGTPMMCPCGEGELECREREEIEDECEDDCDCVGSPNGGRCRVDPLCGNICDVRCLNRRNITFPGDAFASCEFPCPTTRRPGFGNQAQRYFNILPDYCKGGTPACQNPNAAPVPPAGQPQNANDSCGFYLRLRMCHSDCGDCEKNRLEGYYNICSNIRRFANGERPPGLDAFYDQCAQSNSFREYADGMMFCLQAKASDYISDRCASCNEVVSGLPDVDIESGIIGAHTECNDANNFCDLARIRGGAPLRCFGAALGRAWGSILGHQSPIGAMQPVGMCHLISQLLSCAEGDPFNLLRWQSQICEGYVDGCMTQQNLGNFFPDCHLPGIGSCRDIARRRLCEATCPQFPLAALAGFADLGADGAIVFERACNSLLTQGITIFGFPVFPGLGNLGLPGTGSGRDPCLTY